MTERKKYTHISFDKSVSDWIKPMVERKTLGYESITEFIVHASREKLDHYLEIGMHPWSLVKRAPTGHSTPTVMAHGGVALAVLLVALVGIYGLIRGPPGIHGMFAIPQAWDPLAFYNQYWFLVDFLIYATIFMSAAYITIGRMFQHRGIALGVGLLLAIAMASLEATLGFAIRDFGPFAAAILTIILGATLFHVFRALHFDLFGASTVTLMLIYLGMIVTIPPVHAWLVSIFPPLGVIVTILFVIGIYHLATRVFRQRGDHMHLHPGAPLGAPGGLQPFPPAVPELQQYYPELREEQKILKTYLESVTKRAKKDAKTIATELTYIYHILSKFGDTPESRVEIAKKLKKLLPEEQDLDAMLQHMQKLIGQLQSMDVKAFGAMKSAVKKLKPGEARALQRSLKAELEKINAEEQLQQFQSKVTACRDALLTQVNAAVDALNQGNVGGCKQAIAEGIKNANQAGELIDEMKSFEELIEGTIKKEIEEYGQPK